MFYLRCADCLHCPLQARRAGGRGVTPGTDKENWATEPQWGAAEGRACPDLMPRWTRRAPGGKDEPYLQHRPVQMLHKGVSVWLPLVAPAGKTGTKLPESNTQILYKNK